MKSKKPMANCLRRVRLYFNHTDKQVIKQWFGCVRETYNNALEGIKEQGAPSTNLVELRKRYVNKDAIPASKAYLYETTPKHVRDGALLDLTRAFKSNFTKKKRDDRHHFEVKFRKKKEHQSIVIPYSAIKVAKEGHELKMYPTFLKNKMLYQARSMPESVEYDCRLTMDRLGSFHLCIPLLYQDLARENQAGFVSDEWVALDPGQRTFMVGY